MNNSHNRHSFGNIIHMIRDGLHKKSTRYILSGVMALLCCVLTFYLFELYTHNPFVTMTGSVRRLNIVFYLLVLVLLFGLTGRLRVALWIETGFFLFVGLLNYYVLRFRDTPIMPWDLYSISTAATVANDYDYTPERKVIAIVLGFVLILLLAGRCKVRIHQKKILRCILVASCAILLMGYTELIQLESFRIEYQLYDKLFTPTVMNRRDGNVVAFLMELEYLEVDMPSGYSREEEKALLHANNPASVSAAMSDSVNLKRPNIIVIMNEAFSDPAVLLSKQSDPASGLPVNQDYMPYVHELMEGTTENTITGYANVSILGGNTANSEFEFLTGATMAFLPPGSVPYQQYVHDKMPSLASQLASLGYSTIALHPYNADGWERDRVYPLLGFQRFLSLNDMEYRHSIRNYLSDQACYSQIISLYEEKAAHTPLFTFAVTMQNHGGYTDKDPTLPVNVEVDLPHATTLNRYLSLILRSDNALERFIRYFEEEEEDTMIVFFGDHQPTSSVTNPVLQGNGIDLTSFSEENSVLKYKVPYLIWANFEIEDANAQETSLNYLALDILKNCNLPENAYQTILKEIREDYPIVSAMRAEDAQGQVVDISALEEYQQLQYYILFDES